MAENVLTLEDLIEEVKKKRKKPDIDMIKRAYKFATEKHGSQLRKSGEPYIIHPLNVAYILAQIGLDEETICAALLHDVMEDTDATKEEIIANFGTSVEEMVDGITKLKKLQYVNEKEEQVENYRKMFLAMGKDMRVILIKLADRLHNMRTLQFLSRERQVANAQETLDLYTPLANRLGIYSIKSELEDISFKYLHPKEYKEISDGIKEETKEEKLAFLDDINKQISESLKKEHIDFEIQSREKHLYSIYKKMQRDNKTLDEIYDLFAIRILVDTVKDCYTVLGVVHELYNPMDGRFKDYIAVPKSNMYQSIHTTLIGRAGIPFEVQIRTWDMHRVAEFGIAAHWAYKEANKFKKSTVTVKEDKLAWIRETLEWQKDTLDPEEFMKTLKTELFEDEVYVFTPRGDIKVLPKGSTAIDLAYNIHAEIGHKMVGVKINNKMRPILTELQNGDIVEIITSDTSSGPSQDWLKFVKSSSAKNKIQQWFKKAQRDENIVKGKDAIDKELKRIGIQHEDIFKPEWVQKVLERYKFANIDDMYSSVGFGAISAGKIIQRFLTEYRKENEDSDIEEKIKELENKKTKERPSNNGIIVKGIDNCLVKLSKCCNPLPGDDIVGYITKGRGVSVHRTDCTNVKKLVTEGHRLIDVSWYQHAKVAYNVDIDIYASDRKGLLADIIKEIGKTKAKLMALNSKVNKENVAITEITVEIEDISELSKVVSAIKNVESVFDVARRK